MTFALAQTRLGDDISRVTQAPWYEQPLIYRKQPGNKHSVNSSKIVTVVTVVIVVKIAKVFRIVGVIRVVMVVGMVTVVRIINVVGTVKVVNIYSHGNLDDQLS